MEMFSHSTPIIPRGSFEVACEKIWGSFGVGNHFGPFTDFCLSARAETNANVNKRWKRRAKGNDVFTNVISANQHFASTFSMQILKFQRRSCKLSSLFPPRRQNSTESLLADQPEVPQLRQRSKRRFLIKSPLAFFQTFSRLLEVAYFANVSKFIEEKSSSSFVYVLSKT